MSAEMFRLAFVGVGPQRTGTSWLDRALREHPALCLPQQVKEPMYFDAHYERGSDWYASHFSCMESSSVCGEFGPTYFDVAEATRRVANDYPDCRVIITLRDPVARALSLYRHELARGRVPRGFEAAAVVNPRIVDAGHYAKHVMRWEESLSRRALHVVLTDDIEASPEETVHAVHGFLGVDTHPLSAELRSAFNQSTAPRSPFVAKLAARGARVLRDRGLHRVVSAGKALGLKRVYAGGRLPDMKEESRARLRDLYRPDVEYVEELLGRSLPEWSS